MYKLLSCISVLMLSLTFLSCSNKSDSDPVKQEGSDDVTVGSFIQAGYENKISLVGENLWEFPMEEADDTNYVESKFLQEKVKGFVPVEPEVTISHDCITVDTCDDVYAFSIYVDDKLVEVSTVEEHLATPVKKSLLMSLACGDRDIRFMSKEALKKQDPDDFYVEIPSAKIHHTKYQPTENDGMYLPEEFGLTADPGEENHAQIALKDLLNPNCQVDISSTNDGRWKLKGDIETCFKTEVNSNIEANIAKKMGCSSGVPSCYHGSYKYLIEVDGSVVSTKDPSVLLNTPVGTSASFSLHCQGKAILYKYKE